MDSKFNFTAFQQLIDLKMKAKVPNSGRDSMEKQFLLSLPSTSEFLSSQLPDVVPQRIGHFLAFLAECLAGLIFINWEMLPDESARPLHGFKSNRSPFKRPSLIYFRNLFWGLSRLSANNFDCLQRAVLTTNQQPLFDPLLLRFFRLTFRVKRGNAESSDLV